jgi:hypothetical protein
LCFFSLAEIRWTRSSESETSYRDADALHAVLEQQKGKAMIPVHYPASALLPEVGLVFCCRPRLQILARFKRSDGAISLIAAGLFQLLANVGRFLVSLPSVFFGLPESS